MKAATIKALRDELKTRDEKEIMAFCLRLARFKKENKELLTYLLFDAEDEEGFIEQVQAHIDEQMEEITSYSYYLIKKGIRKTLKETKKYIRYSQNKETEVRLLLYFCQKMEAFKPSVFRNYTLAKLYDRQIELVRRRLSGLHEDLQYDLGQELEELDRNT